MNSHPTAVASVSCLGVRCHGLLGELKRECEAMSQGAADSFMGIFRTLVRVPRTRHDILTCASLNISDSQRFTVSVVT